MNNYKIQRFKCCYTCEHVDFETDGDCICGYNVRSGVVVDWQKPVDRPSIDHLGVCDKYESDE